ncbi:hypothetical protein FEZ18_03495 [Oceanihabitans sp. IOP_32]|uniref:hypothetical protein n=1 Tax=Oceanihabitans sp. IOP_32 TaxID=2529032 RepID=UPI001293D974|nr:hypothetical protein [Oceanihabitans sp. IOP_32]QFZ53939.1 hypothetical protein FEZ18_03495 [Oceanihabitans sp. IOP_32]
MRRIISYNDSISDENLIQLIGESEKYEPESSFSDEQNSTFLEHHRICQLLNDLEFTIESYGLLNFFIDYSDQIIELEELSILLEKIGHKNTKEAIDRALSFYNKNVNTFRYLETNPVDFDSKYKQLEIELNNFYIPLNNSIKILAQQIRKNTNDFFINSNLV